MNQPSLQNIVVSWLRTDGGTQTRMATDEATVDGYAESMKAGTDFPPLDVFFDGSAYWVADGHQRTEAARRAEVGELPCHVHAGTQRDALLFSLGANASHGRPLTSDDKRRKVEILLDDAEWGRRSVAWIAETARVHWNFAEKVIKNRSGSGLAPATRIGRDGRERDVPKRQDAQPLARESAEAEETPETEAATAGELKAIAEGVSGPLDIGPEPVFDRFAQPVPPEIVPAWRQLDAFKKWLRAAAELKTQAEKLKCGPGGEKFHLQTVQRGVQDAADTVRQSMPFAVCPQCDGLGDGEGGKCEVCAGLRWLTDGMYAALPVKLKRHAERYAKKAA